MRNNINLQFQVKAETEVTSKYFDTYHAYRKSVQSSESIGVNAEVGCRFYANFIRPNCIGKCLISKYIYFKMYKTA